MSITPRQTKLYTDRVSIYKPTYPVGNSSSGFKKPVVYSLVNANVACKYFSVDSRTVDSLFGMIGASARAEYSSFHFLLGQEIEEGYIIKMTSTDYSNLTNKYFTVVSLPGGVGIYPSRRANLVEVLVSLSADNFRLE